MTDNNKVSEYELEHPEEGSAYLQPNVPESLPDVEDLRNKFFKECTYKKEDGFGTTKYAIAPHDLFEWFKREFASWQKSHKRMYEWQLCPKCNGDGNLLRYNSPNSTTIIPICDVCYGAKIIPKPFI